MIDATVIETARLRLRPPSQADFPAEATFLASERARFVGGPMNAEEAWRSLATILGHWVLRGYGFFAVEERSTGAYCGRVGPWFPEGWPEPEIGWTVTGAAEGLGIAREAAEATRHHAYGTLGWATAISLIDAANTRSIALAERLGCRYEREFDHARYGRMGVWRHPAPEALQ